MVSRYVVEVNMVEMRGTQDVKVDIKERDILEEAVKIIERRYDIKDRFLNAAKTEVREDDDHYHGSVTDSLVRKANPGDKRAFDCIELLKDMRKD
jgi:hypothetical protein